MQNRLKVVSDIFSAIPLHRRTTVMGKVAGALLAVSKIKNAVPLIHGPVGCAYQRRINPFELSSNFFEMPMPCTDLTELDTVYGGEEALKESILQTYERYHPKLIVVITTCQSDIIGDDVKAAINEIKADIECDVVFSTGSLFPKRRDISVVGTQDVLYAIVDQLLEEKVKEQVKEKNSVNVAIFSVHGAASEMSEMKGMLEKIGIKINGIYFDGTAATTVEDLKNMPRAELNIVDYPQAWAILMKEKFGIDYIETFPMSLRRPEASSPFGVEGGIKFFTEVAEKFGLEEKAIEVMNEEKRKIEPELKRLRAKLGGKKIAISPLLFFHSGVVPILLSDLKMDARYILLEEFKSYSANVVIIKFVKLYLSRICKKYGMKPEMLVDFTTDEEIEALKSVDLVIAPRNNDVLRYQMHGIKAFNAGSFSEHYGRIGFKTSLDLGEMLVKELNKPVQRSPLISMLDYDAKRQAMTEPWARLEDTWRTLWGTGW
ncbi:nitrogenase molybdenum-cofactor synthesis protein NifE [ANME-1 cluster archaeon GoMg1]|nr:nitrogenase molybdenum-cofactor synthesis protein NifE [ANME-1 cluster archaeon GoMg1]